MRGGLAALALVVGYLSVSWTLASTMARGNPALSHRLAPGDGRITTLLAMSLSGAEATSADRRRAAALARAALARDPTAVQAVSVLGLDAELRRDPARARRLFAYSQRLSRRDLRTQLWAIERAVADGDVAGALRHYYMALRTNTDSWDLLFPVLGTAIAEPAIRTALVGTLAARPIWGEPFIAAVAGSSHDPQATGQLFHSLDRARIAVPRNAWAPVINALIDAGRVDEAWRYYVTRTPGAIRTRSRDPDFVDRTDAPSLLDWAVIDDGNMGASIARDGGRGVFDFAAPPGTGGALLQQAQLLPPGRYRVDGISSGIEQDERALPYWVLSCRQDGRELGKVIVPVSARADGRFVGEFTVPAGCPAQMLTLIARPSDLASGATGRIEHVQLSPLR